MLDKLNAQLHSTERPVVDNATTISFEAQGPLRHEYRTAWLSVVSLPLQASGMAQRAPTRLSRTLGIGESLARHCDRMHANGAMSASGGRSSQIFCWAWWSLAPCKTIVEQ